MNLREPVPMVVAWESTRACNLVCRHCRAEAQKEPAEGEMTTEEILSVIDSISTMSRPVFIISGGEPLMRGDVFEVARYASGKGFRVVMSPNGTLLDRENIRKMLDSGVSAISVSIDGSSTKIHDTFRGVDGSLAAIEAGLSLAREMGLKFQVNTTVTRHNVTDLEDLYRKVIDLGAMTWDLFMLVPTGRGKLDDEISAQEYEEILGWIHRRSISAPIHIKVTCGPHYQRVARQSGRGAEGGRSRGHGTKGCLAGNGFCFISHRGEVFPCGYFPIPAGNLRQESFDVIYRESPLFRELRDESLLTGKCGRCEFKKVCGGCRARALGTNGSYLGEEPFCIYEPGIKACD